MRVRGEFSTNEKDRGWHAVTRRRDAGRHGEKSRLALKGDINGSAKSACVRRGGVARFDRIGCNSALTTGPEPGPREQSCREEHLAGRRTAKSGPAGADGRFARLSRQTRLIVGPHRTQPGLENHPEAPSSSAIDGKRGGLHQACLLDLCRRTAGAAHEHLPRPGAADVLGRRRGAQRRGSAGRFLWR